jgi:hypothetical protein
MGKKKARPVPPDLRPQRTREHVLADLSANFVERFFFEAGHSVLRVPADYGYDLIVQTFDEHGYAEQGFLYLQLKATDAIARYERNETFAFPIEVRHYHLWRLEPMPVYFVLYDAALRRAYWLYTQPYFASHPPRTSAAASLTIHVPKKNAFARRTIKIMRGRKANIVQQMQGGIQHHG